MFILAPLTADVEDYLKYWVPFPKEVLDEIWSQVTAPVMRYAKNQFSHKTFDEIMTCPVTAIDSDEGTKYRKRVLSDRGPKFRDEYNASLLDSLYVTFGTPAPYNKKTDDEQDPILKFHNGTEIDCSVHIGSLSTPDVETLKADIYGLFLTHLYLRMGEFLIEEYPKLYASQSYKGNGWRYIVQYPKGKRLSDSAIAGYLEDSLAKVTVLRMENLTFESLNETHKNLVKNHCHVLAEKLVKPNRELITAIKAAEKDGFSISQNRDQFPQLLGAWMLPYVGDIYYAASIYRDTMLYEEIEGEMCGSTDYRNRDLYDYLKRWATLFQEMEKEMSNNDTKWTIVITNLIHM